MQLILLKTRRGHPERSRRICSKLHRFLHYGRNDNIMKKGQKLKVEKPKQYQQGWTEFYKLKFFITEDTLIPRPETELLIDETLALAKTISHQQSAISILDI